MDYIRRNLDEVLGDIQDTAKRAAKKVPTLVAVTKSATDEELLELIRCGACDIGENRPQELQRRARLIDAATLKARIHQIGTLQSNKIKLAVPQSCLIHSLDKLSLAERIDRYARTLGVRVPVLVEVNSAKELNKSGVMPQELDELVYAIKNMSSLSLMGLMTMGPVCENEEDIRPYFCATRRMFEKHMGEGAFEGEGILSMGMSDSYRVAIEEGSTLVRVGRRLFIK